MILPRDFHDIVARSYVNIAARTDAQGTSNAMGVPGSFPMIVIVVALLVLTGAVGGYKSMRDRNS